MASGSRLSAACLIPARSGCSSPTPMAPASRRSGRLTPRLTPSGSWPPIGRQTAARLRCPGAFRGAATLTIVNVADKTTQTLYRHRGNIGRPRWTPDGKGLLVPLDTLIADRAQIWHIAYPGGAASRFTNDLTDYSRFHFDRTADGKTLAIVSESPVFNIEVFDPANGSSRPLTTGGVGGGPRTMTWGGGSTLFYNSRAEHLAPRPAGEHAASAHDRGNGQPQSLGVWRRLARLSDVQRRPHRDLENGRGRIESAHHRRRRQSRQPGVLARQHVDRLCASPQPISNWLPFARRSVAALPPSSSRTCLATTCTSPQTVPWSSPSSGTRRRMARRCRSPQQPEAPSATR